MYGDRSFGGQRGGGFSPVQVGQELDVKIEAVGEKGDGIAKEKGFVLFVPNAKEGDEVRIKVTRVLKKVGFAEVVGQAEGPIESNDAPAEDNNRSEDTQEDDASEEPQETSNPEDSEDFGSDLLDEEEKQDSDEEDASEEEKKE